MIPRLAFLACLAALPVAAAAAPPAASNDAPAVSNDTPAVPSATPAAAVSATPAPDPAPAAPSASAAAAAAIASPTNPLSVNPADLLGAPAGPPVTGDVLRERTLAAAKLLRCPVCQGLSVADSPSESAQAIKEQVQDLVAQGYDTDQVLAYFEASYGEFILLEPRPEGINLLVWALPLALVGIGGAAIAWTVTRAKPGGSATAPAASSANTPAASPSAGAAPPSPAAGADPALAEYLRRVREESR